MPLGHHVRVVSSQNPNVLAIQLRLLNLMLWLQEHLSCTALQKVLNNGVAECEGRVRLLAENHHVGEVHASGIEDCGIRRAFAEDAARGEDFVDGVDDDLRRWLREIAGVVLQSLLVLIHMDICRWAYNRDHSVRLQQGAEALQELQSEEVDWLCTASEDIMHNVVICHRLVRKLSGVFHGILENWDVVLLKAKVLVRKLMDNRVDLHDRGVNAMCDKGRGCSPNTQSATNC